MPDTTTMTAEQAATWAYDEVLLSDWGGQLTYRYTLELIKHVFKGFPKPPIRRPDGRLRIKPQTLTKIHMAIVGHADDVPALEPAPGAGKPRENRVTTRLSAQIARLETRLAAVEAKVAT